MVRKEQDHLLRSKYKLSSAYRASFFTAVTTCTTAKFAVINNLAKDGIIWFEWLLRGILSNPLHKCRIPKDFSFRLGWVVLLTFPMCFMIKNYLMYKWSKTVVPNLFRPRTSILQIGSQPFFILGVKKGLVAGLQYAGHFRTSEPAAIPPADRQPTPHGLGVGNL